MPLDYITLPPPLGGLVKRFSYDDQPPNTTPSCFNVRPWDPILGRERIAMRPGSGKAFSQQISGGANPINLVTDLSWATGGVHQTQLYAAADGELWRDASGTMTQIANYSGLTLATDKLLTAASFLQTLYIAGDSSGRRLCKYNPHTDTLSLLTASVGSVPTGCTLVCSWNDRLVVAGDPANPHLWYASRQGEPSDWDYAQTDNGAAVSATSSPLGGRMGDPITALVPHTNRCMIIGCTSSIQILRGDPRQGGTFDVLSENVGILDACAWCRDPEGYLYFMTHDGLYGMPPGCGDTPTRVSRELLPEELLNIDRSTTRVTMAFDLRHRGIHLFLYTGDTSTQWWIAVKSQLGGANGGSATASFWPLQYPTADLQPSACYARRDAAAGITTQSSVILGCKDGYLRRHNSALAQDDSNNFNSNVEWGPFDLAPFGQEGILNEVQVVTDGGDVDMTVRTGDSAQAASDASTFATYEFNAEGLNYTARPRARGKSAVLRFSNGATNSRWALESVTVKRKALGRLRIAS